MRHCDGERQTCPRRMQEFGPWSRGESLDAWDTGRWGTRASRTLENWYHNGWVGRALRALQEVLWRRGWHGVRNRLPNPYSGGTYWPHGFPAPRDCSFCGSAHPDDVVRLLKLGWELEPTDKGYKHYIEPPGSHEAFRRCMKADPGAPIVPPGPRSPTPPVKLYGMHVSRAQADAINVVLRERRRSHEEASA